MSDRGATGILTATAIAGLAGAAATGPVAGWERFWINWIHWLLFLLTLGLGCLFIVALEHVVGAKWSVPLRRVPERLSSLILLACPIALLGLFSLPVLYPWTRPESLQNPVIAGKSIWLNIQFFTIRAIVCIGLWVIAYRILIRGSMRQDQDKDPKFNVRARRFAPAFMVLFGITLTVVAFDWISSLEPEWYSDIFGVYIFAGTFLAGLAATVLAVQFLMARGRLPGVTPDHVYNLGGFLFAFTVFWSYIGFAQYMLMWYANLPEEVFWYKERLDGLWGPLLLALAVLHFFVPFFVLIPRDSKKGRRRMFWISILVLFAHWLDLYWMIFPAIAKNPVLSWPEIAFGLLFISAALLWIRRAMTRGADMPVGDPFLREGLEFRL